MKVITACTDERYYFPYLKKTCMQNNGEFVVLGLGEKWGGYIWKFNKMIEYLKTLDVDEVVCFVDGYDVVCVRDLRDIKQKFLECSRKNNCKIIIGKDNNILPEIIRRMYFGDLNINSGTYIGRAGDIRDILKKSRETFPDIIDDQMLIIEYAKKFKGDVAIDEDNTFFQVHGMPFFEARVNGSPYFIHAPGCSYLNDILQLDDNEKNRICKDLRKLFIEKATYHVSQFCKKYILLILLIIIIIFILHKRKYFKQSSWP